MTLSQAEMEETVEAVKKLGRIEAAKSLGLSYQTIKYRMKKAGVKSPRVKKSKPKTENQKLWDAYSKNKSLENRNRLIEHYLPAARIMSLKIVKYMPNNIDKEALVATGIASLIPCIDRFNPKLGLQFSTFMSYRIRGAVLDELREQNLGSRSRQSLMKQRRQVIPALTQELQRFPSDIEIMEVLGWDRQTYLESLDITLGNIDDPKLDLKYKDENPLEVEDEIRKILRNLCLEDAFIIYMLFWKKKHQDEIAKFFGVSESYVHILKKRIFERMRLDVS